MGEFENPQDSQEGWEMMQRLIWTFMMEFTGKNIAELTVAFEKWAENLSQEQMDQIFNPKVEGEPIERNLQEEGPLHSKEDILKSMWSNND